MAMRAPKLRKHLSADALLSLLRSDFADMPEHRPGKPDIALSDALMAAFAMFSLKSPSLLAFDKDRTEGNVQQVYGIERVPCDTAMREILDPVEPECPSVPCSSASLEPCSAAKRSKRWSLSRATTSWPLMARATFLLNRFTVRRVWRPITAMAP